MPFRISSHAIEELTQRDIPTEVLDSVLNQPQQIVPEHDGRVAYQSQLEVTAGKRYLVRAIVDETESPPAVITVYRTSRIAKYWRTP